MFSKLRAGSRISVPNSEIRFYFAPIKQLLNYFDDFIVSHYLKAKPGQRGFLSQRIFSSESSSISLFDSLVWGATRATLEVEKYTCETRIAYLQENVSRILRLSNNRLRCQITARFFCVNRKAKSCGLVKMFFHNRPNIWTFNLISMRNELREFNNWGCLWSTNQRVLNDLKLDFALRWLPNLVFIWPVPALQPWQPHGVRLIIMRIIEREEESVLLLIELFLSSYW